MQNVLEYLNFLSTQRKENKINKPTSSLIGDSRSERSDSMLFSKSDGTS